MTYEKLKAFNLNDIKSQEQADEFKAKVLESNKTDILKYINFLRWQQFNSNVDIKYINRIVSLLSFDEIMDIEKENSTLITGDVEDLILTAVVEQVEVIENPIHIDGVEYSVKTVLEDDFESVIIVSDGEKLHKFGFIIVPRLEGIKFWAYELYEESQEYYQQIVDATVGTKVNVYCDIVGENQVTKTFKKSDLTIEDANFELTKKTNKGILTPVNSAGMFSIVKKEEVLSVDGISEDRLQSQLTKFQSEIADKLNKKEKDCGCDESCKGGECDDCEETEKTYTKEDFADDFQFSEKYQFSVVTPNGEDFNGHGNRLTETILLLHDPENEYDTNTEYVAEVYELLYQYFGISSDFEGQWTIPNTKLEKVMRKIIGCGGEVHINAKGASLFLNNILKERKIEKVLSTKMNIQVVKKIKTQEDVKQFAKDAGTELYVQIGQTITAILEGAQRLYGDNHIVFDSDRKLVICQYDELDLVAASNYAIDNEYKCFYVIEKDKFTEYDAWVKESLSLNNDDEDK